MNRYFIQDPAAGFYAVTQYGESKRAALNAYRAQWYPNRRRLPKGVAIWGD